MGIILGELYNLYFSRLKQQKSKYVLVMVLARDSSAIQTAGNSSRSVQSRWHVCYVNMVQCQQGDFPRRSLRRPVAAKANYWSWLQQAYSLLHQSGKMQTNTTLYSWEILSVYLISWNNGVLLSCLTCENKSLANICKKLPPPPRKYQKTQN